MPESLKNFLKNVPNGEKIIEFQGLSGSSKALLLSIIQTEGRNTQTKKTPLIVVCESFDIAEVLIKDLHYFIGKKGIHFFPFWDVLPYDNFSPHKDLVAQRFNTLDALINKKVNILVTTPNAMMQRFLPCEVFKKNTIFLDLGFLEGPAITQQQLLFSGYNLVEVVEDRGEFSSHGLIIDVFPINFKNPVRIEFSKGNKIVSIKQFDIQTQLTSEIEFESIKILPGNEIIFDQDTKIFARKKLPSFRKNCTPEVFNYLKNSFNKSEIFPGIESLSPVFYPKLETLFDYLPLNYILIINEEKKVKNRADHFFKEIFMEYELSTQQNKLTLSPESLFITSRELELKLQKSVKIFLTTKTRNEKKERKVHLLNFLSNHSLRRGYEKTGATSALGHMINQIQDWNNSKIPILLSAKNQTHADHIQQVLGDLGVKTIVPGEKMFPSSCPWLKWIEKNFDEVLTKKIPILYGKVSEGFQKLDENGKKCLIFLTEEEIFGERKRNYGLQRKQFQQTAGSLDDLRKGDHVVHFDYGIGLYNGLEKISAGGSQKEFMQIIYAREERVFVPIENIHLVQKYVNADGKSPKLSKLGEKSWQKTRKKVAKSVENIALELAEIYAKRKIKKGFAFQPDNSEMQKFELSFNFEETPDQLDSISAVKTDMESEMPMDRVICGDVGFGKTEIAMRAAFKAVEQAKQVAILVPTTILAQQHYETFRKRFQETPYIIEAISRFRTDSEQKNILKQIHQGKIDIIIGTHRLLSKDVKFLDLGLLVVDEEQRFGVIHKEKIKHFRANIDVLTLSATPIPRTLHMSLMGLRDLSLVNTPPADRRAIRTRLLPVNEYIIQEAVSREIRRGGQVFIVHNRVESIYEYGKFLQKILPKIRIAIVHGKMREQQLEKVMLDFIEGSFDVLLSTTIIESGLDIPKANTILINNAHNFGLSQLYQLRGRVGRSNVQAYAYLLVPPEKILSGIAHERLQVLQDFNDLGAGFRIASKDLEIRGAGNLLGSEQSGQIASIGLELYTQMVNRAVKRLKQIESGLTPEEIKIRFDHIEQHIPDKYIKSTSQRLSIYKALGTINSVEELWDFRRGIEDRFGLIPETFLNIFRNREIRLWGQSFGVESIEHKMNRLRIQFRDITRINPEKLIKLLFEKERKLSYIPEDTIEIHNVPAEMISIIQGLKSLEKVFMSN